MQTKIWAHRGASHKYIENSLAAFEQAVEDRADGVELDVQRTLDGELIVFHDENFKRLTGVNKFVWELTWEEIQSLTLSSKNAQVNAPEASNTKIPRLEEVLFLLRETDLDINIELKNSIYFYPDMEAEVIKCVRDIGLEEQVYYSSFNHESVHRLSKLVGPKFCGLLTSDIQLEPWHYLKQVGASAYHPMINSLQQKDLVKTCHENGIKVHIWTADKEEYISAGLLLGVDAIITNEPEKAVNLRQQFINDEGKKAMESVRTLGIDI